MLAPLFEIHARLSPDVLGCLRMIQIIVKRRWQILICCLSACCARWSKLLVFLLGQGLLCVLARSSREKMRSISSLRVITNPVVKAVRFIHASRSSTNMCRLWHFPPVLALDCVSLCRQESASLMAWCADDVSGLAADITNIISVFWRVFGRSGCSLCSDGRRVRKRLPSQSYGPREGIVSAVDRRQAHRSAIARQVCGRFPNSAELLQVLRIMADCRAGWRTGSPPLLPVRLARRSVSAPAAVAQPGIAEAKRVIVRTLHDVPVPRRI